MVDVQNPTSWFDQFNSKLDEISGSEQWCARHWAPATVYGANGLGASIEMMQLFVEEVAPDAKTTAALDARLHAVGRVCCTLGDEMMYEIWAHWPPRRAS